MNGEHLLSNMRKGQITDHTVSMVHDLPCSFIDHLSRPGQILVSQHDAFGRTGGSAGVDERRKIVILGSSNRAVTASRCSTFFEKLGEGNDQAVIDLIRH